MLVIFLLSALLFALGLALPTNEDYTKSDGSKNDGGKSDGGGYSHSEDHTSTEYTSGSADCAEMVYYAQFTGSVCGIFVFKESGYGGSVSVETIGDGISGLDAAGGPYSYHIHNGAINNGDCNSVGTHYDPYGIGDKVVCNPADPKNCQVGDLSEKHGDLTGGPSCSVKYDDEMLSLNSGDKNYIGGQSLVIHKPDKYRLACANIVAVATEGDIPPANCPVNVVSPSTTDYVYSSTTEAPPAPPASNPPAETTTAPVLVVTTSDSGTSTTECVYSTTTPDAPITSPPPAETTSADTGVITTTTEAPVTTPGGDSTTAPVLEVSSTTSAESIATEVTPPSSPDTTTPPPPVITTESATYSESTTAAAPPITDGSSAATTEATSPTSTPVLAVSTDSVITTIAYTSLITLPGTTLYSEITTAVTTTVPIVPAISSISIASVTSEITFTSIYTVGGSLVTEDVTTTIIVAPPVQTLLSVQGPSTFLTTIDDIEFTTVLEPPAPTGKVPTGPGPAIFTSPTTRNGATTTGAKPAVFTGAASGNTMQRGGYLLIAAAGIMAYC